VESLSVVVLLPYFECKKLNLIYYSSNPVKSAHGFCATCVSKAQSV